MKKVLISIKEVNFFYESEENYCLSIDNLEINEGEIVALIGTNGAGKTSLLSILAGIIEPNEGELLINGEIFSLISLDLLIDDSKNGYENIERIFEIYDIKLNEENLKECAEYTELSDEKLKNNLKTYSTGMKSRIAFAPLSLIQKDIYLIDEIMAVGDIQFASKSYQTIVDKIKNKNCCTIICTHSISTVLDIATKVIWLENGEIFDIGEPKTVCKKYSEFQKKCTINQISKSHLSNLDKYMFSIEELQGDKLKIKINIKQSMNENFFFNISRLNGFNIFKKDFLFSKTNNEYIFYFSTDYITDQHLIFSLCNHNNKTLFEKTFELNRGIKYPFGDPLYYVNDITL